MIRRICRKNNEVLKKAAIFGHIINVASCELQTMIAGLIPKTAVQTCFNPILHKTLIYPRFNLFLLNTVI
jgi:hypothetical protein